MQATLSLAELAQLMQVEPPQEGPMGLWRFALRSVGAGETLFRQGDRFRSMYVVRTGFFRSSFIRGATEHVVAFPMMGDALGMDGIGPGAHPVETAALTDAQVAVVPYALLEQMECLHGSPGEILLRLLCRENACKSELVSLLGHRNSTSRAAAFLLRQSARFAALGYSHSDFPMPMRHADVGSYLGLRPETLSRAFGALGAARLARISLKAVKIRDLGGLRAVADSARTEALARVTMPVARGTARAQRPAAEARVQ